MTDWPRAFFVGGVGLATVFVVLGVLCVVVWASNLLLRRVENRQKAEQAGKKAAGKEGKSAP